MTDFFCRDGNGVLQAESVALTKIAGDFATPTYVYSRACIEQRYQQWSAALGKRQHTICYAVKANPNIAILALMSRLGAGFDIVSGGELQRVLTAGGDPARVVFSGVGKSAAELELALRTGLKGIHVESLEELKRLAGLADRLGVVAPVAVRVCPEVEADTHKHIITGHSASKFGMSKADSIDAIGYANGHNSLEVVGIACHIGSQIIDREPFAEAAAFMDSLRQQLSGIRLRYIDMGGGLGVSYHGEKPSSIADLAEAISALIPPDVELVLEPGRSIVAPAGVLLTTVEYVKHGEHKNFAVVDAGMNDFVRPAMYDAWHNIEPVRQQSADGTDYDIVGPVCETGDCFAKNRKLSLKSGDLLAIRDVGAYGASMACEYNTRPKACELLVAGSEVQQIRSRGEVQQILQQEHIPDNLAPEFNK